MDEFKRYKWYVQMKGIKRKGKRWGWAMSLAMLSGLVFFQFPGTWRQVVTCFLVSGFCLFVGAILSMTMTNLELLTKAKLEELDAEYGPRTAEIERRMREEKPVAWKEPEEVA